jgi:repressor LexA
MPIEALEGQSSLPVPAALLGPGEHYALEVAGDSMVDEGILDGDYALIRKTDVARDGEIVVALIDDERSDAQDLPPRRPDDPPRPRQPPLRPAALPPRAGPHPGPLAGLLRRY